MLYLPASQAKQTMCCAVKVAVYFKRHSHKAACATFNMHSTTRQMLRLVNTQSKKLGA